MSKSDCHKCTLRERSVFKEAALWIVYLGGVYEDQVCTHHLTETLESLRRSGVEYLSLSNGPRPPLRSWEGAYGPVDEYEIELLVQCERTEYQHDLLSWIGLHERLTWYDKDFTGKRWNAATISTLKPMVKEDPEGEYRAVLTDAGREVINRMKENEAS